MKVEQIEWIDKDGKEAIVKVASEAGSLKCFSCPCSYENGDEINEPLECLDVEDIIVCDVRESDIIKADSVFNYIIRGKLIDKQNGYVEVCGFPLHIEENRIPKDIENGMYIQFVVSRIDIW